MAGKTKAQAQLHKTKSAGTKKGQDALSKLVTSCNEQVQQIQAMLYDEEHTFQSNHRHAALKSRADTLAQTLSSSTFSTRSTLQKILGESQSAQRKLEHVKHNLSDDENGNTLEEMMDKMQSSVDQFFSGLIKGAGKMKKIHGGHSGGAGGKGKGRGKK